MNIHRHILYIIRTFFLDITLLTKSYGRRLIGRYTAHQHLIKNSRTIAIPKKQKQNKP